MNKITLTLNKDGELVYRGFVIEIGIDERWCGYATQCTTEVDYSGWINGQYFYSDTYECLNIRHACELIDKIYEENTRE